MSLPENTPAAGCFDELLGVRGVCDERPPAAGLWADDVGVTRRLLADILTADYENERALWDAKRRVATTELAARLTAALAPRYRGASLLGTRRLGYVVGEPVTVPAWTGWRLRLEPGPSHLALDLSELTLCKPTAGDYEVRLLDLTFGTLLNTTTVTVAAGESVGRAFPHWRVAASQEVRELAVVAFLNGAAAYRTQPRADGGCGTCAASGYRLHPALVTGGLRGTPGAWTSAPDGGGMTVTVALGCDHAAYLCAYARSLALPLLYRTAAELYHHGLTAATLDRFNPALYGGVEALTARRDELAAQADAALARVLGAVRLPPDPTCFDCDRPLRVFTELP